MPATDRSVFRGESVLTELEKARAGEKSQALMEVAQFEGIDPETLRCLIADGRVVITWAGKHQDKKDLDIFHRIYSTDLRALSNQGIANLHRDGKQEQPSVTVLDDGTYTVLWSGRHPQENEKRCIFVRRFSDPKQRE